MKYYQPKHEYEQMIIEGTRLLEIKDDGRSGGYGSYVRMKDTGETCFACPNGQFFRHEETQRLIAKVAAHYLKGHHPTDAFSWKPIVFPYTENGEIDFGDFIFGNRILAFPTIFWGHESYDKQIAWIMKREGVNE